jgi:hypothetical protein
MHRRPNAGGLSPRAAKSQKVNAAVSRAITSSATSVTQLGAVELPVPSQRPITFFRQSRLYVLSVGLEI